MKNDVKKSFIYNANKTYFKRLFHVNKTRVKPVIMGYYPI